jgi:capsid portal protein
LAVLVSGGVLTQQSMEMIEDQLTSIKGRQATHRMVILEARGDEDLASQDGQVPIPRIELKPLRDAQQKDALFAEYEVASEQKVRSAFRLPPLFVGRSQDITFASAQTSYEVAEGQVFGPERRQFDSMMDLHVLGSYDAKFWAFRSQQAKITDPSAVVNAMTAFNDLGAMTPNIAIALANEYFDLELEKIKEDWGNWPFEIVKNLASAGKLEGSQVIERKITVNADGSKTDADGNLIEAAPQPKGGLPQDNGKTLANDDTPKDKAPPKAKKVADEATLVAVSVAMRDLHDILRTNADAQPATA